MRLLVNALGIGVMLSSFAVGRAVAEVKPAGDWDTTKALGQTRDIDFDTSEEIGRAHV